MGIALLVCAVLVSEGIALAKAQADITDSLFAGNGTDCKCSGVNEFGRIAWKAYRQGTAASTREVVYCFDGKKPVRLTGPVRVECGGSIVPSERGFLTGVGNIASRTEYEHDIAGRTTRVIQITEGSPASAGTRAVSYQYWASDRISETTLPSTRRVVECIDARLRVIWACQGSSRVRAFVSRGP